MHTFPSTGSVSLCSGVPALQQVKNIKPDLFWTNRMRVIKTHTLCCSVYTNILYAELFADLLLLRIIDMYVNCHHVNQVGQLDSSNDGSSVCVCQWVPQRCCWMVGIRDIHTEGQSKRRRQRSCLKRPLFVITTSKGPLCTSFPLRPSGIFESSMMTMMMVMMSQDGQTPSASSMSLNSSKMLNGKLTENKFTCFSSSSHLKVSKH